MALIRDEHGELHRVFEPANRLSVSDRSKDLSEQTHWVIQAPLCDVTDASSLPQRDRSAFLVNLDHDEGRARRLSSFTGQQNFGGQAYGSV